MKSTIFLQDKKATRMVAHRGLSGIETENTNAAFTAAGNRSYFGIETDVHVTRDGRYILIHDDSTARVTGGDALKVEETSYETLRSLHLVDRDTGLVRRDLLLPDLADYFRICRRYGKVAVLELKNAMDAEHIAGIAAVAEQEGVFRDVIFISFCFDNLVKLRAARPAARAQFLTDKADDATLDKLAEHKLDLDIYYMGLTEERVRACHSRGIEVNCWTVDNPEDATRLIGWGVDYITSNILE